MVCHAPSRGGGPGETSRQKPSDQSAPPASAICPPAAALALPQERLPAGISRKRAALIDQMVFGARSRQGRLRGLARGIPFAGKSFTRQPGVHGILDAFLDPMLARA